MSRSSLNDTLLRRKIAREAAILLYTLQEKEYKQAKLKAAKILGTRILPTNREIAEELDIIAEEHEGQLRRERLIRMRREALEIMEALRLFNPRLVGSVWRGTANQHSDIDITVFSSDSSQILDKLQKNNFKVAKIETVSTTEKGEKVNSLHIFVELPSGDKAEIILRDPEKMNRKERCEIYGDTVTGLNIIQLKEVLKENPLEKFIPHKTTAKITY